MNRITISLICFLIIIGFNPATGQEIIDYRYDDINFRPNFIKETNDGNYIISASKSCWDGFSLWIEGCPIAQTLMKINPAGDIIWESDLLPSSRGSIRGLFEDKSAPLSFIAGQPKNGMCNGTLINWGFTRSTAYQLTETGEVIDSTVYNDECGLSFFDHVELPNGDILYLGSYGGISNLERQLTHFDTELNIKQSSPLDSDDKTYQKILLTEDGNIFLTQFDTGADIINLVEVDTLGNILSSFPVTNLISTTYMHSIVETSDDALLFLIGRKEFANDDLEYLELIKMSFDGTIIWTKQVDGNSKGVAYEDSNQNLIVGTSHMNLDSTSRDIFISLYNLDGDIITTTSYDNNGHHDDVNQILINEQDELTILGISNCCHPEWGIAPTSTFIILDTVSDIISSAPSIVKEKLGVEIYPNPLTDQLNIKIQNNESTLFDIEIMTTTGKTLYTSKSGQFKNINLTDFPNGIYILKVMDEHQQISTQKFIKQE